MISVVGDQSLIGAEVPVPIIFQKEDLSDSEGAPRIAETLEMIEW